LTKVNILNTNCGGGDTYCLNDAPALFLLTTCMRAQNEFDLVDINLFLNIAETDSLTHGAERSFLSVPSASTRIRNMEERLGTKLLYRSSHGVGLTPAGHAFLHHGRIVLQQLEHLRGDLQEYACGLKGHLRLCATTSCISEFLPAVLRMYLSTHPDVNVNLKEHLSRDIVRAVNEGTTDLGIVADIANPQGLETLPYRRYRYVLAMAARHPLAKRKAIAFEETLDFDQVCLLDGTVMHAFLMQAANELNRKLRIRVQVGNFEALCRMVENNVGIGLLPEPAAKRHIKALAIHVIPLTDGWAFRNLQICARSFKTLPLFAKELVEMLLVDSAANGGSR
jgi:DNA-binding transcriptional LysR family regulator